MAEDILKYVSIICWNLDFYLKVKNPASGHQKDIQNARVFYDKLTQA